MKAIAYARTAAKDPSAISNQLSDIRKHACEINAEICAEFWDDGASGLESHRLQDLFKYIKSKKVDAVIVTDMARLSRDMLDLMKFRQDLNKYGVKLITLSKESSSFFSPEMLTLISEELQKLLVANRKGRKRIVPPHEGNHGE